MNKPNNNNLKNDFIGTAVNYPKTAYTRVMPQKMASGGRGFTLLELVFTILVIGILSAIAIPVYNSHLDKMKIDKAIADIYLMQSIIERYHSDNFSYPPDLTAVSGLPNNGLDPWGNAYVYLNIINGGNGVQGQVRKDHSTNPINTQYDLYSKGKDGLTHVQVSNPRGKDDIVLGRDGGFVGLGADF